MLLFFVAYFLSNLDKVSILSENKLHFAICQRGLANEIDDILVNVRFAQSFQIFNDVSGLKSNGDGSVERVGRQLVLVYEFGSTDGL